MTDNEKRAHDLAILYEYLDLKEKNDFTIDPPGLTVNYLQSYDAILGILENSKN